MDNSGEMYRTEADIVELFNKMQAHTGEVVIKWKPITRCYCPKCETWKDVKDFSKDKSKANGYSSICKDCKREYFRRPEVAEKQRARMREMRDISNQ